MSHDAAIGAHWLALLGAALAGALVARRAGVSAHLIRDGVHVGAGIWVLGWPAWDGLAAPLAIVGASATSAAIVPLLAGRQARVEAIRRALCADDERWAGIAVYAAAYAVFTGLGLAFGALPAATALLALSFGDGIGGWVGRTFGRIRFRVPGGKTKTLEGSLAVAVAAAAGAMLAQVWFAGAVDPGRAAAVGCVAAAAEAVAPRASDNIAIPLAVYGLLLTLELGGPS